VGGAALLVAGAVIIVAWAWQNLFSGPSVQRVAATSSAVTSLPSPATQSPLPAGQSQPPAPLPQTQQLQTAAKSAAPAPVSADQHVTLQASELTWVSARDSAGKQTLARVFQKGDTQTLNLPNGATVRVGNAGGLSILLNGASIGTLGAHGQVREVVFRNGSYKVVVADQGR
jgi:cytoskeleton protein RodZ